MEYGECRRKKEHEARRHEFPCQQRSENYAMETHPRRYAQDTPYAAVTTHGGTTGRNASPTSLVYSTYLSILPNLDAFATHVCNIPLPRTQRRPQPRTIREVAHLRVRRVDVVLDEVVDLRLRVSRLVLHGESQSLGNGVRASHVGEGGASRDCLGYVEGEGKRCLKK